MKYGLEAREQMFLANKRGLLPRLNAFGAFETNDNVPFSPNGSNWMAGFQLQWDIFKGNQRAAASQKTKLEMENAQLEYKQNFQKSQLEFQKAQRDVQLASQKLETTSLAVKQAEEVLRFRKDRYEQGLEKTNEVLMAEAQLSEKQLEYLQNLYEYHVAAFYVDFLLEK